MNVLIRPLLLGVVILGLLSSCTSSKLIPMYTSVEKLANLDPGMSKQQALSTLDNVYPFDILNGESNLCEIHHYKYKHLYQNIFGDPTTERNLRGGNARFMQEKDVYVVYRNGLLYSVTSNIGDADFGKLMADVQNLKNACEGQAIIKGCTDPESVNYNPDAQSDDGSCQYCDCGMVKNPNYNAKAPKTECNSPCIAADKAKEDEENGCNACDVLKDLKGSNVTLNLTLDGNSNSKKQSSKDSKKLNMSKLIGK